MDFSVVTPSFNQLMWLKLCAASVNDQPVAVEHIVQDAVSTDGTGDWLKANPRIRSFVEADAGMYDAINRGLRRSKGALLVYLNCDEQLLPGTLGRVAAFFEQHPDVDVVFGDIVIVDERGEYLCHRKVQEPRLYHTWTCHLSTLSCAMFFRRSLVEDDRFFFNTTYRCGGDGEWMVRLLKAGVPMAALGGFTSIFTSTGRNLSRNEQAREEWRRLARTAPRWVRGGRGMWVLHHRLRRLWLGAYRQSPFSFRLFTQESPTQRIERTVNRPVFRQNW